jgi:hypothetical protein
VTSWQRRNDDNRRAQREIDEELAFHLETTVEELEATGLARAEAEARALRRFGSMAFHRRNLVRLERQAAARIQRRAVMEVWRVGLRSFVRGVAARPAFAAAVIAILALGLGVNAVAFRLVDRLVLSGPSGLEAPDRLYRVVVHHREAKGSRFPTPTTPISITAISWMSGRWLARPARPQHRNCSAAVAAPS